LYIHIFISAAHVNTLHPELREPDHSASLYIIQVSMGMTLIMQFFEDCQMNRENIVKEVLYKKARVLACVEEGKKPVDESLSNYLHAAVGLLKEVCDIF